eukprot:5073602-Amphidinium_carterae.1
MRPHGVSHTLGSDPGVSVSDSSTARTKIGPKQAFEQQKPTFYQLLDLFWGKRRLYCLGVRGFWSAESQQSLNTILPGMSMSKRWILRYLQMIFPRLSTTTPAHPSHLL